jgi:flagellar protein FlaG
VKAVNISMSNNVVIPQQASEPAEAKRPDSSESVTEISSATPLQDAKAIEQGQSIASVNRDAKQKVDEDELESAVVELNKAVQNMQRNLEFSVDDATGRTVVKVKDRETDEIIRQMPSEEVLKLAQHMHEHQSENGTGFSLMQELKA